MDIKKILSPKGSMPSAIDEYAYEIIANEISSNQIKQGLWTKALADGGWNDAKAKVFYVRMRHAQLIAELNLANKVKNNQAIADPIKEARDFGLTDEDLKYLEKPIKATQYLIKYKKTQKEVLEAISKKKINAVMKNEVLWVSDSDI